MKKLNDADLKEIVYSLRKSVPQRVLARKYNVGKGTIQRIKDNLHIYADEDFSKRLRTRTGKYCGVDEAVFELFLRLREQNIPVSGTMLRRAAIQFSTRFNIVGFKASSGWLQNFKTRNDITFKKLWGEAGSADCKAAEIWKQDFKSYMIEFNEKNIFNCDETSLFYKMIPNKTMLHKEIGVKGIKTNKQRISILLACSMKGEKLDPLFIGYNKKPHCFKNINIKDAGIQYKANNSAWMTSDIFFDWLVHINTKFKEENRKILLILDNCSSHKSYEMSHIKLCFIPPNTSSILQPLDMGIKKR